MTRVVSLGLGTIGLAIADAILRNASVEIVGAVDASDAFAGKHLQAVLSKAPAGVMISGDLSSALTSEGGVVVQATSSKLSAVMPQLEVAIGEGWNILSTSEELMYAHSADPGMAAKIHELALHNGVSVLGAGVNPGFLMDVLPLVLTGVCLDVKSVFVRRIVNTNARRLQLQRKVGVGMRRTDFEAEAAAGRLGHVGLRQSALLIADTLGWTNLHYEERLTPVLATKEMITPVATVPADDVVGQHQVATVHSDGQERVRLELQMYAGAEAVDEIQIEGEPSIHQVVLGGVNGDIATAAVISNLIGAVEAARPGLLTMAQLLPMACAPRLERVEA